MPEILKNNGVNRDSHSIQKSINCSIANSNVDASLSINSRNSQSKLEEEKKKKEERENFNDYGGRGTLQPRVPYGLKEEERNYKCGLNNLGNTCFMNAALQCLIHTNDITESFLSMPFDANKRYFDTENVVANEFCNLVQNMWKTNKVSFSPEDFKSNLGFEIPLLVGGFQHDSYDFFDRLRSCLIKELNRKNNLIEENFEEEKFEHNNNNNFDPNSSILTKSFYCQTNTTFKCSNCNEGKDNFVCNLDLKLPIPSANSPIKVFIKFHPLNSSDNVINTFEFIFEDQSSKLIEVLSYLYDYKRRNSKLDYYLFVENGMLPLQNDLDLSITELLELSSSTTEVTVFVYELNDLKENQKYYNFELWSEDEDGDQTRLDQTFKIAFSKYNSFLEIHKAVFQYLFAEKCKKKFYQFWKSDIEETIKNVVKEKKLYKIGFAIQKSNENTPDISEQDNFIEFGLNRSKTLDNLLEMNGDQELIFRIVKLTKEFEIKENKQNYNPIRITSKKNQEAKLNIYKCLDKYCTEAYPEECSYCNQYVDCIQRTKISIAPKNLVFYLNKFKKNEGFSGNYNYNDRDNYGGSYGESYGGSYGRGYGGDYGGGDNYYEKRDDFIDYPTDDFDLKNYYEGESPETNCIYDLYAVIHHSGDTRGGHYWATIRNKKYSEDWYRYDDSSVRECRKDEVVSKTGYVLFYEKRNIN